MGHRGGLWHNLCDISGEAVEFSGVSLVAGEGVSLPARSVAVIQFVEL